MFKLKQLQEKKAAFVAEQKAILALAVDGILSAEQQTAFDAKNAEIDKVNAAIATHQKLIENEQSLEATNNSIATAEGTPAVNVVKQSNGGLKVEDKPVKAYANIGEQFIDVIEASKPGSVASARLQSLSVSAIAGASERVGSDGGFLVQSDFSSEILKFETTAGELLSRVKKVPISADKNGLILNAIDENSRVDGSRFGGVQTYWEGEGDTVTAKKPKFRQMEIKLNKAMGLMYATSELMSDSTAFGAIATDAFQKELLYKIEKGIFEGNGAGMPLGFTDAAGAIVTVSKETNQAAATIVAANIWNMWARLWNGSRKNAVWFVNQDTFPALQQLSLAVGTGGVPMFQPAGGISGAPYATLLGRPIIEIEHCETLGTKNDIILADLSQYLLIEKGAAEQALSVHVRFIYDEIAIRLVQRVGGQSMWKTALTPAKGTNTVSPFVNLATRA